MLRLLAIQKIIRDPRFGRNSELPGEDPFVNGNYAKEMIKGFQEEDSAGHPKVLHIMHSSHISS